MQRRYFGTDGVRGPYGGAVVNERFFAALGAAAARWLASTGVPAGLVLIGADTRASGRPLSAALAAGLASVGARPRMLGVVPTPAVSRAVRLGGADLGAVVTASHNPSLDNGVKFFGRGGVKLTDAEELEIESLLRPGEEPPARAPFPHELRSLSRILAAAAGILLAPGSLRGWKLVLDTANGATCMSSGTVLKGLGADVLQVGDSPDGRNINLDVGSEHPEALAALVRSSGARLGIAHDGDGDRCVLCDERGGVLDGDEVLAILATRALSRNALPGRTLVVTVQSNLGLDAAVRAAGGTVVRTAVGDRYVTERMRSGGFALGGESSGHIVCADIGPSGDGLVAALKVIEVMLESGKPLSELRTVMRKFPQGSLGLSVREKKPLESLAILGAAIRKVESDLGPHGRVLVRYSGTEPKLRILVEGPTEDAVSSGLGHLGTAARSDLEVV